MHRTFAVGPPYRRRTAGPDVDCGSFRSIDRLREGSGRPAQMNDILVQLIVVAVLANVVLLLAALIVPRLRRPSRPLAAASSGPSLDAMSVGPVAVSAMPATSAVPALTPPTPEPQGESSTTMRETEDAQRQRRFFMPREDEYPTPESVEAFLTAGQRREDAGPMVDEQTGLETGFAWEMAVEREERRVARYGKSVTVVVAELDRLEALAARLGSDNADRLVAPVATTLRRLARAADLVARTGHARFHVLMPETDDVQAINYVERVRDACDMWLDASAVSVRLVLGWAAAGSGVTIRDATRLAEQRMHADRARSGRGRPSMTTVRGGGPSAGSDGSALAPTAGPIETPEPYAAGEPDRTTEPPRPPDAYRPAEPPRPPEPYRPAPGSGPTV